MYGTDTLADVVELAERTAAELGFGVRAPQTNHEGEMIDAIHEAVGKISGIVINPAGGRTLRRPWPTRCRIPDADRAEAHISNVHKREKFRQHSYVSPIASGIVAGYGIRGLRVRGQTPGRAQWVGCRFSGARSGARRLGRASVGWYPATTITDCASDRSTSKTSPSSPDLGLVLCSGHTAMPVKQTSAEIDWPAQTGPVTVSALLTAYVPVTMSATIPCGDRSPRTRRAPCCRQPHRRTPRSRGAA